MALFYERLGYLFLTAISSVDIYTAVYANRCDLALYRRIFNIIVSFLYKR